MLDDLYSAMAESDLTQRQLSELAGMPPRWIEQNLCRLQQGQAPHGRTLARWAKVLGVATGRDWSIAEVRDVIGLKSREARWARPDPAG